VGFSVLAKLKRVAAKEKVRSVDNHDAYRKQSMGCSLMLWVYFTLCNSI
jgi:hypothetical protein